MYVSWCSTWMARSTTKSVKAECSGASQKASRPQAKKSKKRIEGQREMLLPIAGKKGKEAARPQARTAKGRLKRAADHRVVA
jgi:DNA end-binding protein Ku